MVRHGGRTDRQTSEKRCSHPPNQCVGEGRKVKKKRTRNRTGRTGKNQQMVGRHPFTCPKVPALSQTVLSQMPHGHAKAKAWWKGKGNVFLPVLPSVPPP